MFIYFGSFEMPTSYFIAFMFGGSAEDSSL